MTARTFQPKQTQVLTDFWNTQLPTEAVWGIYARQSTQAQVLKNVQSTEMQTDDLIQWLVDHQVKRERITLFDADLGMSGTLRIDQRTGLQELVSRIQADTIKAVLVYQISRLFRDETGVQYNVFANISKQHYCVLVTAADGMIFNFHNPMHMKMFRYLAEMAAEYIPQQIGLLNAAKIRKARKGLWAGLGAIPSGYIVDYCKGSPTFEKLIPYLPHKQIIVSLYERLYALCGNFQQFCRELDEMAFLFPPFESWVEQRIVAQCRRRKVPGGTHLSRRGLISLLTNPVYLGWWIVQGDIISRENHEPIIDKDHEYLFWYAFNLLSDYTVDGDANEQCQKRPPRRFSHKTTEEQPALLKDRIATPNGKAYAHITRSTCSYVLYPAVAQVMVKPDAEVEAKIIDAVFKTRFFERLEATHDFDVYQRWIAEETQKQESIYETICAQLSQIAVREQVIMKEIIAIQTKIIADTKTEEERKQLEQEAEPIIEGWRNQLMMLVKPKKELAAKKQMLEKDEQLVTARKFADFQTELRKLIPVWEKKPIAIRREFVNLFVEQAVLRVVAPHFVQLDIFWTHPAWEADRINIYRRTGAKPYWTDEEKHILRTYYPLAPIDDLLQRLPQKTWGSIKQEAIVLGIQRNVKIPSSCSKTLTVTDVQFMIEHNIPLQDVRPNCESLSWRSSLFKISNGSVQDSHPNCESPPRRCADEPIHPLD